MMKGENKGEYENVETDEKPPVYDHTQAIIKRDEKRTASVPDLLKLVGMDNLVCSKDPIELVDQQRFVVLVCLTLSSFFQAIVAYLSVSFGDNEKILAIMTLIVHIACSIKLFSEHISHKFFLVSYAGQFLLNTMLAGYGMLALWSPSICRKSTSLFSYQQCQDNLGFIQVMGATVLIGNVLFQTRVLHILYKVYKHAEMNKNVPKTASVMLV